MFANSIPASTESHLQYPILLVVGQNAKEHSNLFVDRDIFGATQAPDSF